MHKLTILQQYRVFVRDPEDAERVSENSGGGRAKSVYGTSRRCADQGSSSLHFKALPPLFALVYPLQLITGCFTETHRS